jgi:hypothetical protein
MQLSESTEDAVISTLLVAAIHAAASLVTPAMCDRPGPQPVGFHSRGFSYVAEVFPPHARRNTGDHPRMYLYEVGYPGSQWRVDARRLWTAALPIMPRAALISMAGHVVTLDEHYQAGGDHAVVVFAPEGRLVRSIGLEHLLDRADLARVELSDCGRLWRDGAAFYFSRPPDAKLYVVFSWGRAVEIDLATGALRRGGLRDFETLRELTSQRWPNELAESWEINLRFSSLTDMLPPD